MTLVTGGAGFVGRALVPALAAAGVPHAVMTRADVDLADVAAVASLIGRLRPQAVIHLAACLDKRETVDARAHQWRDTFGAGVAVIEAAAAAGVPHLILPGSIEELGEANGVIGPSQPGAPASTYGLCKDLLRQVALHRSRTAGMRVDWFRPFVVYGPGQTGSMLLPYAFATARDGLVGEFSDGLQERDLLYIDDLVSWCRAALLEARTDPAAGLAVHHLGRGESVSVRDVLGAINEEFPSARFEFGRRPRRLGEPDRQCAPPVEEATSLTTWRPATPWREGIRRTAAWWKQGAQARSGQE